VFKSLTIACLVFFKFLNFFGLDQRQIQSPKSTRRKKILKHVKLAKISSKSYQTRKLLHSKKNCFAKLLKFCVCSTQKTCVYFKHKKFVFNFQMFKRKIWSNKGSRQLNYGCQTCMLTTQLLLALIKEWLNSKHIFS
jgi:hypothetical protein